MIRKSLLVVTSTFPRWHNDTTPPFVFELCKRLVNQGFDVDVLAPHAAGASNKEVMENVNVFRYSYCPAKYALLSYNGGILANLRQNKLIYLLVPFFLIAQAYAIWKRLSVKRYDVVHAHWIIPQGFLCIIIRQLFFRKGPKILCTSHGSDLFTFQTGLIAILRRWALKYVNGMTVVSEYMKTYLNHDQSEYSVYVCPMGVDLKKRFVPQNDITRDTFRIIYVGRLVENKGIIYLLKAVKIMTRRIKGINLIIVGDGPDRAVLEDKCKELMIADHVCFYGGRPQKALPALYSSASIAVIPSIVQEGLGLTIIEAMGCGCAVVATSFNSVNDIITNHETGILVKLADSDDLAMAMTSLFMNREKLGSIAKKGRERVLLKFDWDLITARYSKILNSLC